jgi:hypothetical protein
VTVNQGGVLLGGHPGWATWARIAVNYATPFLVASLGYYLGGRRAPAAQDAQQGD